MGSYTDNLFKRKRIERKHETRLVCGYDAGREIERLVSCAIIRDGVLHKGEHTHVDLRRVMGDENPNVKTRSDDEGYYTDSDRFIGRYEACEVGILSGQVYGAMRELLSCDVKW